MTVIDRFQDLPRGYICREGKEMGFPDDIRFFHARNGEVKDKSEGQSRTKKRSLLPPRLVQSIPITFSNSPLDLVTIMSSPPSDANEPLIHGQDEHPKLAQGIHRGRSLKDRLAVDKIGLGTLFLVLIFGLGVATGRYIPVRRSGLLGKRALHVGKDREY